MTPAIQPRLFDGVPVDPAGGGSDEWYTPRHIIEAARSVLGGIDLDPASCATAQEIVQAGRYYTKEIDGLSQPWYGRVWLNPPYSMPLIAHFTGRLWRAYENSEIERAILLVNNQTDTAWCHDLLIRYPVLVTRQRIKFFKPARMAESAPRQGQLVFYLGPDPARFARIFSAYGTILSVYREPEHEQKECTPVLTT